MAAARNILFIMLVLAVAFESANCYFRLGREMETGATDHVRQNKPINSGRFLDIFMDRVAACVKRVSLVDG